MKRILTLSICLLCIVFVFVSCGAENSAKESNHEIVTQGDLIQYDYDELTAAAKIIAKVEVLDNLSDDNSTLYYDAYDADPDSIVGYCSKREVRVVEVYKGSEYVKAGDSLKIIESAAISGNSYFHSEGYTAMVQGNTYLVYLNNDTASQEMSIMSCSNGRVNLTDPQEDTDHLDIVVKSLAEFESDLPKSEKEKILNSQEIQYLPNTKNENVLNKSTRITIGGDQTNELGVYKLDYGSDIKKGQLLIRMEKIE